MSAAGFETRLARVSDAKAIANMSRDLIETGLPWRWQPPRVEIKIRDPEVMVLVVETRIEIAGFGIMEFGPDRAHLSLFAVREAHRRTGVGRALLSWLTESALTAGMTQISLEVRERNAGAQAFYHSMGYRNVKTLDGYYEGREAALQMVHRLIDPSLTSHEASPGGEGR